MTKQQTLDDSVVLDPEPEPEPEPDVKDEAALPDLEEWVEPDQDWPHQWIEYEGDRLAVRKPQQMALAGYHLSQTAHNSMQTKFKHTGTFIANHLSPDSYDRVIDRLMNPDEPAYTVDTVGELMKQIIELTTGPTE